MFPMPMMMCFMMVVVIVVVLLLLVLIVSIVRSTEGKAKRTDVEKPKRHRLTVGDDGELVAGDEDENQPLHHGKERE